MLKLSGYEGKKIGVLGLGKTGLATVAALVPAGGRVFAFDDNPEPCAEALALGAEIRDFQKAGVTGLDSIVLSPGIPLTHPAPHPVVTLAQAAAVPIVGDIEIFARALPGLPAAKVVAITGTNGKSTTTALIGHVLQACGRAAAVGGNIGLPVLAFETLPAGGIYVIEMSSYQIDLTTSLAPDAAVLLNLSPDHLDRHGDMAGYIAAKKRLFLKQNPAQAAVIGIDDAPSRDVLAELQARAQGPHVIAISCNDPEIAGVSVVDGTLYDALSGVAVPIGRLDHAPGLVGRHNWQNAAAAYAVARALGLGPSEIFGALVSFPGLAHRMELVTEYHGVKFINDSKATNIDAASRALGSYKNIYWIAGGKPKSTDLSDLAPCFPNIAKAFLIGEAAEAFAASLAGRVEFELCGTLAEALDTAAKAALASPKGPAVVLLSPASASFDQFKNFEDRGNQFGQMAKAFIAAQEAGDKIFTPAQEAGGKMGGIRAGGNGK